MPTENEIALLAYQLWQDNGCPAGSAQADWVEAEDLFNKAPAAQCKSPLNRPSVPRGQSRNDSGVMVEFRCQGHWEVWESEWGGAHWICD